MLLFPTIFQLCYPLSQGMFDVALESAMARAGALRTVVIVVDWWGSPLLYCDENGPHGAEICHPKTPQN